RPRRQLGTGVEPLQKLLRCAPQLAEPQPVESRGRVGEPRRWPLATARERQGRDAVREQRALLGEREREAQVDELRETARMKRSPPGLLQYSLRRGLDERR